VRSGKVVVLESGERRTVNVPHPGAVLTSDTQAMYVPSASSSGIWFVAGSADGAALLGDGEVEPDDVERVATAELRGVLLADGEMLGVGVVGQQLGVVDRIGLVERQLGCVAALVVEPRPRIEVVELDGVEALPSAPLHHRRHVACGALATAWRADVDEELAAPLRVFTDLGARGPGASSTVRRDD
jgi:hypothetical protein